MNESAKPQPQNDQTKRRFPPWMKRPLPAGGQIITTRRAVQAGGVATVCQQARCPNLAECWSHKTATFMIMGDRCTRKCLFCAVRTAPPKPLEPDEPKRLTLTAAKLGIKHLVVTSVARDDLADEGAGHFAACIRAVRNKLPATTIEVLPPDFHARPECIAIICDAGPDIFNHNLETVERLSPNIRPQADYQRSLQTLRLAKQYCPDMPTKSGLMVGLGETIKEIHQAMADLCQTGCQILTVGQYLQPTPQHAPTDKFYTPDEFENLTDSARKLGFTSISAGPYVRSSYNAAQVFEQISLNSNS